MPHLDMSAWAIEKVMRVLMSCCRGPSTAACVPQFPCLGPC